MTKQNDFAQELTQLIIKNLENVTEPCELPWNDALQLPKRSTTDAYQGSNILNLMLSAKFNNFTSTAWITYKQATQLKAQVIKGSKATKVAYVGHGKGKEYIDDDGEIAHKQYKFLTSYNVFNLDQIENLPAEFLAKFEIKPIPKGEKIQHCEDFIASLKADIQPGIAAYYKTTEDQVVVPKYDHFKSQESYYSTLFHELIHWTGHKSRCDRSMKNSKFSPEYAYEELIAELGAAFLCAEFGIQNDYIDNNTKYIKSWLGGLNNDKTFIIKAATEAQKAITFMKDLINSDQQQAA